MQSQSYQAACANKDSGGSGIPVCLYDTTIYVSAKLEEKLGSCFRIGRKNVGRMKG